MSHSPKKAALVWLFLLKLGINAGDLRGNTTTKGSFPSGSAGNESDYIAGDAGSIPGPGRSPEVRHGDLLQYSFLENPVDRGA